MSHAKYPIPRCDHTTDDFNPGVASCFLQILLMLHKPNSSVPKNRIKRPFPGTSEEQYFTK